MTRRLYLSISVLIDIALLALLIYSLDRTSWLLAQYELSQPDTLAAALGLAPLTLGVAAALVIEVGAVALVAGDVLALAHTEIKRYATVGLIVVLAVQALANLLAGFLRGYQAVLDTLVAHGANDSVAHGVAGFAWVLSSSAVPALIFVLSKLAALTLRLALEVPVEVSSARKRPAWRPLQALQERLSALKGRLGHEDAPRPVAPDVERIDKASAQALEVLLSAPAEQVQPLNGHAEPGVALALVEPSAPYECPHCNRPLKSKQARGAAVANGFCPGCKAERRAA